MNNFVLYTWCLLERPCSPLDSSKMNVRDVFGLLQYSRELVPVSEAIIMLRSKKQAAIEEKGPVFNTPIKIFILLLN